MAISAASAAAPMATTSTLAAISSMAMRPLLAELLPQYARDTGIAVALEAVGGVDAARRVAAGEAFDVAFLARPALDALASAGRAGAAVDLARSSIAVAVRAGAPAPDLTSEDTLRRAVAAAQGRVLTDRPRPARPSPRLPG